MRKPFALAALLAALSALPALAQEKGGCSGFKWPVDREETAFASDTLPALEPGTALPGLLSAAVLKLKPQAGQTFTVEPAHKPRSSPAYAGEFPMSPVAVAGPYQVTISARAWIDVVQNGKLLQQIGFTDSRDCHAVFKSVRFNLATGPAMLLISDAPADTLKVDVLPPGP